MAFYNNWGKGWKWLLGITTGGVGNVLLKTVNNMIDASNDMDAQRDESHKQFMDKLSGNSSDVAQELVDVYNGSSENPYLQYRNGSDVPNFNASDENSITNWWNSRTGNGLTDAEKMKMMYQTWERQQAENFNHNEAVDARNYEMYMAQNKYQMETDSMRNAGINPALVYGSGNLVPTAATGAAGSISPQSAPSSPSTGSITGLVDLLSSMVRLPLQMKQMNADIESTRLNNQLKEKDIEWYEKEHQQQYDFKSASIDEIRTGIEKTKKDIENGDMDLKLKQKGLEKADAEIACEWAHYTSIGLDNKLKEQLNPLIVEAQKLENQLATIRNEYEERRILAELAEKKAHISALYAQAALDGARKEGVDLDNKIKSAEVKFAPNNAQNRANLLRWTAYTQREKLRQGQYATSNAQYYSEHYEEAFRNSWSQSGTEFGVVEMLGQAIGNAAMIGMALAF